MPGDFQNIAESFRHQKRCARAFAFKNRVRGDSCRMKQTGNIRGNKTFARPLETMHKTIFQRRGGRIDFIFGDNTAACTHQNDIGECTANVDANIELLARLGRILQSNLPSARASSTKAAG